MLRHVSVVIPTYNGQTLLQKNLPSVLKALKNGDEVVIVDDSSSDLTLPWLDEQFKTRQQTYKIQGKKRKVRLGHFQIGKKKIRILVLQNSRNLRFARSVNRGVQAAKFSLIFLLNNDVVPHQDCLDHLLPYFADPAVFGVAPLEIEQAEGGMFGGKNVLEFKRGMYIHRRAQEFHSGSTAWVSGGSGLFDRTKWLQLGGFDPDFSPAYWEDIDLSFRARLKGWKVLFEEKAVVDHNHESTNLSVFGQQQIQRMSWKNAKLFTQKHVSGIRKFQYWLWKPYWWWKMK